MEITISIDGRRVSVEVSAEVAECLPYCASPEELIVTTNIPLHDLQHPQDTAHARIYDRLLEMCAPIRFLGENFRKATAQDKLECLKKLMDETIRPNQKNQICCLQGKELYGN